MRLPVLSSGLAAALLFAAFAATPAVGRLSDGSLANAVVVYPAESNLGGVDLSAYCKHKGYEDTKLVNNTGYGWVCYRGNTVVAISMTDACQWTYGPGAIDRMGDYNDPNSWRCWR